MRASWGGLSNVPCQVLWAVSLSNPFVTDHTHPTNTHICTCLTMVKRMCTRALWWWWRAARWGRGSELFAVMWSRVWSRYFMCLEVLGFGIYLFVTELFNERRFNVLCAALCAPRVRTICLLILNSQINWDDLVRMLNRTD